MDMNQLVEMQQSLTFLGSIGGLASPVRRAPACCARTPGNSAR